MGALRLGWVLAGLSASENLHYYAERNEEYRSERGSDAETPSLPPGTPPYFSLRISTYSGCRDLASTRLKEFREESSSVLFFFSLFHLNFYKNIIVLQCIFYCMCQLSSVAQSCLTPCDPMDYSMPGLPVQLPEFTQTHVHWVSDAIQSSHPLSSPSPPAFNLSQHQGLFHWVSSSHQLAKLLELQLQHQSFQLIFRTDFL